MCLRPEGVLGHYFPDGPSPHLVAVLAPCRPKHGGMSSGARLRHLYLRYVRQKLSEIIDGFTILEWIRLSGDSSHEAYQKRMLGGGQDAWGGFMEIAFLRHICSKKYPMHIAVLQLVRGPPVHAVILAGTPAVEADPRDVQPHKRAAMIWNGTHWQVAIIDERVWEPYYAWMLRD